MADREVFVGTNSETQRVGDYDEVIDSTYVERPLRINKYRIVAHVASGGFGTVYRAYDGILDQYFAIKVPRHDRLSEEQTASLIQEARTMAKLDHPHIVPIREAGRDASGLPYIVMKWIEGPTLKQHLCVSEVTAEQARKFATEIASAIDYAKEKGFTHRDLKPSNILINENGKALVTDFGLALESSIEENVKDIAGTLPYMSPEQLSKGKESIGHRSDIWSLGVIFYEMLSYRRPFDGEKIVNQIRTEAPPELDPTIPTKLSNACMKCLEKSPDNRFQSAKDFIKAIAVQEPGRIKGWQMIAMFVAALALFFGGIGIYSVLPPKPPVPIPEPVGRTPLGRVRPVVFTDETNVKVSPNVVEIFAGDKDCYIELGSVSTDARTLLMDIEYEEVHEGSGVLLGYRSASSSRDQFGASCLLLRIEHGIREHIVSRSSTQVIRDNQFISDRLGYRKIKKWGKRHSNRVSCPV